jgi:hypothetical protein
MNTEQEILALRKRVAKLEVQDVDLITGRLDGFNGILRHMWREVERILGERMKHPPQRTPERLSDTPAGIEAVKEIAQEEQREAAREDGERGEGWEH